MMFLHGSTSDCATFYEAAGLINGQKLHLIADKLMVSVTINV